MNKKAITRGQNEEERFPHQQEGEAYRREQQPWVGGFTPAHCSRQRPGSELCSLQGPQTTGSNKSWQGLPSHLVFIYAPMDTERPRAPHEPPWTPEALTWLCGRHIFLAFPLGLLCLLNDQGSRYSLPDPMDSTRLICYHLPPTPLGWAYHPNSSQGQRATRMTDQDTCVSAQTSLAPHFKSLWSSWSCFSSDILLSSATPPTLIY